MSVHKTITNALDMGGGTCWIPVVWIQIRIRNLIADGSARED